MAGINFLSDNYYLQGTKTITTGTANAQFPLTNLDNASPSVKFRSTGNTVVLEIDLLQVRDIDTVAVVGDPTENFGMTAVSYKTSVTNDFSLSTVNNLTMAADQNIGYSYITSVSHRFVEITFTGQGSYVEVGHIFIGARINLTQNNISIDSFSYGYNDNSQIKKNRYGQRFIDELPMIKELAGSIEFCTLEEQEDLDALFTRHGEHEPLWIIIDKDGTGMTDGESKLTMYGYLTSTPKWRANGGQHYSTSIAMEEAV